MAVHAAKPPGDFPSTAGRLRCFYPSVGTTCRNCWRGQAISSGGFRDYSLPASAATNGWGCFRIYRPTSVRAPRIARCDGRHKFPFECPIIFWTSRQQRPALRCGLDREPLLDGGNYYQGAAVSAACAGFQFHGPEPAARREPLRDDKNGRGMGPVGRSARARIEECGRRDQAKN